MSLVLCMLMGNHSLLFADGRRGKYENNEYKIVSNDTQKIFKINDYTAIGFTGNYETSMAIKDEIMLEVKLGVKKYQYADQIAQRIHDIIKPYRSSITPQLQCIVTGKTTSGRVAYFTMNGKTNYEISETYITSNNEISYAQLCDYADDAQFKNIINRWLENPIDLKIIVNSISEYFDYISNQTSEVSKLKDIIFIPEQGFNPLCLIG